IFTGLGRMYIADPRFKENIDKYGEGTAEFVSEAIDSFCRRKQHD
ncbi:MAG: MerR family transcriptional regulator, partial [Ruminococcaceae bacterium]|nr:MerR family transcriptional regulator [Oscillospiraceae bacterium]